MHNILIADDNADITQVLAAYTTKEGYNPIIAADGEEALRLFDETSPSAVLLDVMMPKIDGYEVCRKIREKSNVPIILVTARGEGFEKIMGLDIGADDYIVKPFSPRELVLRVRNILRRIEKNSTDSISMLGDLEINYNSRIARVNGKQLDLTVKSFELLWLLANNPERVFSKTELYEKIWQDEYVEDANTLNVHVHSLRRILMKHSTEKTPNIKTVWGLGYKMEKQV